MKMAQLISGITLLISLGLAGLVPAQAGAREHTPRYADDHRATTQQNRHNHDSRMQGGHHSGQSREGPHDAYTSHYVVPAYEQDPLHHKHLHKRNKVHSHTPGFVSLHKSWRKQHASWNRYAALPSRDYDRHRPRHHYQHNDYGYHHTRDGRQNDRHYRHGYEAYQYWR